MREERQQNSTAHPSLIYMVSSTDHVTPVTGATVSAFLSKDGAAFGAAAGAVTEIGSGWYALAGNATDRNTVGPLALRATATGADEFPGYCTIVPWDPFDGTRLGLTALPAFAFMATGGLGGSIVHLGGTAGGGTANSITLTGGIATDGQYNGMQVQIVSGTGLHQVAKILTYKGSTNVAIVDKNWVVNPDNTSVFMVTGPPLTPTIAVFTGIATAGGSSTVTITGGSSIANFYQDSIVYIASGTGQGQPRVCTAYNQGTGIITVDRAWDTVPNSTSVVVIYANSLPWMSTAGTISSVNNVFHVNILDTVPAPLQLLVTFPVSVTANSFTTNDGDQSPDFYNGNRVLISEGTGINQIRTIVQTTGSNPITLIVDEPFEVVPDGTSRFTIIAARGLATDGLGNLTGSVQSVVSAVDILQTAADKVWASTTRTLTAFSQAFADQVWSTASRTLTAFSQAFSDQTWGTASRTLTAFSQAFADQVWSSTTRTLTDFGTLVSDVAMAVWTFGVRTLTAFGFGVTVTTNNDKTGYSLIAGAVDAAQFTQAAADKVWTSTTRTLTSFGTLIADIWGYATRTLTQQIVAVTPPPVIVGSTITFLRGDTVSLDVTGLGSLIGRSKLWFTLKLSSNDQDANALVQIEETAGLVRLNGAAATANQGSLVVLDANSGHILITLTPAASATLASFSGLSYDIQQLVGSNVLTLTSGLANIIADVTRATS